MHSVVGGKHPVPHAPLPGESEPDHNDSNPEPMDICLPVSQDGLRHAIPPPSVRWRLSQEEFQRLDDQAGAIQLGLRHFDCDCMLLQSL